MNSAMRSVMKSVTKSSIAAIAIAATASLVVAAGGLSAPKPSEVPVSWELEMEFQRPRPIRLVVAGQDTPRIYWYMLYTVSNRTGDDRIFVPEFVLYTDSGQVLRAGKRIPMAVFEKIKKLHNDPLLKDVPQLIGKLLQGADNAISGVAIWPDIDPAAGAFDVFAGGLSGETAKVALPKPIKVREMGIDGKLRTVVKKSIVLAKTLHLRYTIAGEAAGRFETPARLVDKNWIMR